MDRARSQKSFASERTIPRRRASDSSSAFPPTSTQHSVAPVAASVISGHDYEPSQDDTERTGEGGGEKEQELAREEEEFEKIQEEEKEKEQDEEREEGESGQEEKMWTSGFPGGHREEQTGGNEKRDRDSIPPLRLETLQALEDTQETFQAEVDKRQAEIEMLTSRLATALQEKRVASREREEEIEDLRGQVELLQQQLHMETSRSKGFVINASSQPLSGNSRLLSSASEGKSTPRDTLSAKNEEAIPTLSEELLPSLSSQRTDNSIKGDRDSQDAPEAFPEDPTQGLKEGEEEEEDDGCVENEHEEEKLVERTVTSITGSEGDGTRAGRQVSRTDTIACSESSQKARKGETGTKALADLDETHFSPPVPADRFPSALESSATPSIPDTPTVQSVPQGVIAKILPLFGATFRQYKKQQQQNSRSEWERRGRTMSHQATSGRLSYTPTLTESTKRDSLAVPSPGLFPISPSSPFVYPTVRSEQLETTTAAGSHSVPLPPSILLDTPHRDPVVTETGGPQDAKRETGEQNEGSSLREYFKLAVLAVRLELNESGVSPPSSAASPSELWEEATEAAIPFHKWHSWLRDRLGGRKGGEKQKSPPRPLAAFLGGLRGGSSVKVGGGSSSLFLTPFKESPGTSCRAPESETDSRERAAAGHTCSLSRRSFTGSASQCPSSSFISQQPLPSPLEGDEEETKEFLFQQRQRQEELAFCHFQRGAGVLGDRDSAPASLPSLSERNLPTEAADLERDSECPTERVGCDSTHPTSVGTHEGHKEPMQPHQPPKLSTSSGWRFSLSSVTAPFAALMGHPKAVHGGDSLTWLHAAKSPQCVTETVNSAQSPGFTSADGRRVLLWDTEAGPRGVVGTPGDFSWEERSVRDSNADRFGGLRAATLRRKSGSSQSSDATHEGWRTADSRAVDSKRAENARVQSLPISGIIRLGRAYLNPSLPANQAVNQWFQELFEGGEEEMADDQQ
uniref:Uncharacterized protein n=1 Tax=Chromera velia CCMP2878 TaxID=1169474 RepID=A0A0G4FST4_9ALVE|eukprot:Cvel_3705.t1-p1 / transcript=Cvel_3705.t1 / gene=Cvel_3705 / organism=Chromera_velia_CCMP2878 / gene_product=hypothetical protein / transcript_product=hypothetical protein / location=Cvel_scaffold154:43157-49271(-) / protein_length=970 / sequence_SO=supercontig / SO=protein_coding / is_pseudo=false